MGQTGLFSKIAGRLTLQGLDIVDAKIYTTKPGTALDVQA